MYIFLYIYNTEKYNMQDFLSAPYISSIFIRGILKEKKKLLKN